MSATKMGGTKLMLREMSVCVLLLILSSRVISEQFTAMVKQNGFQLFAAPVFHTVKLSQLFVGVCVFAGRNFPQEVQDALRFGSVSSRSLRSCTLKHLTGFWLCRHEWYSVIWYSKQRTSYSVDIILHLSISCLENTFSSRQTADSCTLLVGQPDQPLGDWGASYSHRSTTCGLFMALQQNFRQLGAVVTFILAIHSRALMLQIHDRVPRLIPK